MRLYQKLIEFAEGADIEQISNAYAAAVAAREEMLGEEERDTLLSVIESYHWIIKELRKENEQN